MTNVLQSRWLKLLDEDREAVVLIDPANDQRFTRGDLEARSQELINEWPLDGIARRAVIMRLPNGLDWLAALLALRRADCVVVPVDSVASESELDRLATHLKAAAILDKKGLCRLPVDAREWPTGSALVKVTSGSTGAPTPLTFTEAEIVADGDNVQATMGITRDDLNYAMLPFAHSYALGNLVAPLLADGVPLALCSIPLPRVIAEEITTTGVTVFPSTPQIFDALARTEDISLGQLRLCITAAAQLKPELAQRFAEKFGLPLHNFYGASECGGIAYDRTGKLGLRGGSVGHAMEGVKLSRSEDGRLQIRSAAVSSAEFGEMFTIGDLVEFEADGAVVILGRADRVVKVSGKRVDLNAVELCVREVHGVTEVVVWQDADNDRLCIAIVTTGDALAREVLAHLQARFGAIRGRLRVKAVAEIPFTARGKVDRHKLAELAGQ